MPDGVKAAMERASVVSLGRFALAAVELGIAGALAIAHRSDAILPCGGVSDGCETVARSAYAQIGPVATADLGVLFAVAMMIAAFLPSPRAGRVLAFFGVIGSWAFVAISLLVIKATCVWCMASAATVTALGALWALNAPRLAFAKEDLLLPLVAMGAAWLVPKTAETASVSAILDRGPLPTGIDWTPPNAPSVGSGRRTVVFFGEVGCGGCTATLTRAVPMARAGRFRLVLRHFSVHGPSFMTQAERVQASVRTKVPWDEMARGNAPGPMAAPADKAAVRRDYTLGKKLGFDETPTLVLLEAAKPPRRIAIRDALRL